VKVSSIVEDEAVGDVADSEAARTAQTQLRAAIASWTAAPGDPASTVEEVAALALSLGKMDTGAA